MASEAIHPRNRLETASETVFPVDVDPAEMASDGVRLSLGERMSIAMLELRHKAERVGLGVSMAFKTESKRLAEGRAITASNIRSTVDKKVQAGELYTRQFKSKKGGTPVTIALGRSQDLEGGEIGVAVIDPSRKDETTIYTVPPFPGSSFNVTEIVANGDLTHQRKRGTPAILGNPDSSATIVPIPGEYPTPESAEGCRRLTEAMEALSWQDGTDGPSQYLQYAVDGIAKRRGLVVG